MPGLKKAVDHVNNLLFFYACQGKTNDAIFIYMHNVCCGKLSILDYDLYKNNRTFYLKTLLVDAQWNYKPIS